MYAKKLQADINKGLLNSKEHVSQVFLLTVQDRHNSVHVSASTVSVPQTDAQYLGQLYTLQQWYLFRGDRLKTMRFLERYPFLVPLLIEAYRNIQRCFPLSLVFLTVVSDPEEFGTDQLTAFITTNLEPERAIDALNNFDKTWWLKAVKRTQGRFCITLEFQ